MISNQSLTPKEILIELDKYIVGQADAKRSVAIALRNRWRRRQVPSPLREEIAPKNIIMIGPTGVGKTEIARRLAALAQSPFIKVEASKYTEVGYVGRDVESMVRDLVDLAVNMVKEEEKNRIEGVAAANAEDSNSRYTSAPWTCSNLYHRAGRCAFVYYPGSRFADEKRKS